MNQVTLVVPWFLLDRGGTSWGAEHMDGTAAPYLGSWITTAPGQLEGSARNNGVMPLSLDFFKNSCPGPGGVFLCVVCLVTSECFRSKFESLTADELRLQLQWLRDPGYKTW